MKKLLGILLFISIALSANAQLLWKVSGKGLEKPSYIFGTYHLSPLSIKDSIAAMPQAMNETTQVYGEVVMSEMATPAFMQSMQQQMMMPKDTTLQNLFTPEQYEEVGKVVKENMMVDIAMLAQLKPAAINQQLVVLLYMKHTPGFNPQEQLDTYFQQQAGQQGKKVGGLETAQSQIDILFNSQTLQRQANLLYCAISDIEKGKVDTVIVKDLSRFGRESIKVNYYTQMFFPENGINFIIIADNTIINANSNYDFMLTIKSAINEIYPAEVSQKVRQAFKAKSMNGEFLHPYLPYGYIKSTTKRIHLVIDEKNAQVVRDIFEMVAYKGMGMQKISEYLFENKILSPAALRDNAKGDYSTPNPYSWGKSSINNLLHNEVYLGRIIYGRRRKVNFKSQKVVTTDRDEWIICENGQMQK